MWRDGHTALDVMEIVPVNGWYDYRAKYDDGGSRHECPADIDAALAARIQQVSLQAHMLLGCRGVTRADFPLTRHKMIWRCSK